MFDEFVRVQNMLVKILVALMCGGNIPKVANPVQYMGYNVKQAEGNN